MENVQSTTPTTIVEEPPIPTIEDSTTTSIESEAPTPFISAEMPPPIEVDTQAPAPTGLSEVYPVPSTEVPSLSWYIAGSSEGEFTVEDTANTLTYDAGGDRAIVDHAKNMLNATQNAHGIDFQTAAASGNIQKAINHAKTFDGIKKFNEAIGTYGAVKVVATDAAEKTATAVPGVRENTQAVNLAKYADEKGYKAMVSFLISRVETKVYGAPMTGTDTALSLATYAAPLGVALAVSGPVGWTAGAALTALDFKTNKAVWDGAKTVLGIDAKEPIGGVGNTLAQVREMLSFYPPEKRVELTERLIEAVMKNGDFLVGPAGRFNARIAAEKIATGLLSEEGLGLSIRTQDYLTFVGAAADVVSAGVYAAKAAAAAGRTAPLHIVGDTAGADVAGRIVGEEIHTGANTLNLEPTMQFESTLTSSLHQFTPAGVQGMGAQGQMQLKQGMEQLLTTLDDGIRRTGDVELMASRDFAIKFLEETNSVMHSYDPKTGEMVLQHPRGAPWISQENAAKYADRIYKETGVRFEVIPANSTGVRHNMLGAAETDVVKGWHASDALLSKLRPSENGAHGPGVYLWLDEAKALQQAGQKGGFSHEAVAGFRVERTVDTSVPMSEQSKYVQDAAKKMGITDPKVMASAENHPQLRANGIYAVGNSKADKAIGEPQINIIDNNFLPVASRTRPDGTGKTTTISDVINYRLRDVQEKALKEGDAAKGKVDAAPKMLAAIAKHSDDADHKTIATRLLGLAEKIGLKNIRGSRAEKLADDASGFYESGTDILAFANRNMGNETLAIHEIGHAVASSVLEAVRSGKGASLGLTKAQTKAAQEVLDLSKDSRLAELLIDATEGNAAAQSAAMRMISDPHEFLSIGLSDRGVIHNVLKNYKVGDTSALEKMVGYLADLFGVEMSAFRKLNDNFLAIADDLTEAQRTADMGGRHLATGLSNGWVLRKAGVGVKTHTQEDIASRFNPLGLADPKHKASEEAVHDRFISITMEAKERAAFTKFVNDTIGKLSYKEMKNVNRVLREGDAAGKEWNVAELVARGIKTDKEQVGYYAYRSIENLTLRLKNQAMTKKLSAEGWFQGNLNLVAGQANRYSPAKWLNAVDVNKAKAWDITLNKFVYVDTAVHSKVFKTREAFDVGGEKATLFIGNTSQLFMSGWRAQIPTLPGSFRRIYKDDYFGRVRMTEVVDGEVVERNLHLRTSRSYKDMEEWSKGMNKVLDAWKTNPAALTHKFVEDALGKFDDPNKILGDIHSGLWNNYSKFDHHYNRNSDDYLESMSGIASDAKDFHFQGRGEELRSIDTGSKEMNIDSPLEALQKEISNVSRMRNQNEWRDHWVQVWWNSFGDNLPKEFVRGRRPLEVMSDPAIENAVYVGGDKTRKFADDQRRYILSQIGQQTLSERMLGAAQQSITTAFSSKGKVFGVDPLLSTGHWIRNADPIGFIRALNFNMMLGMYNPAQMIVQAQQAVTMLAVSPAHATKALPSVLSMRLAMMSDNPAVWAKAAKGAGADAAEFIETIKMVKKSGILNGIASTSLHNIEAGAFNTMTGWTAPVKRELGRAAFFFNRTEEMMRLGAFEIGRREFIASNPGVAWNTDAALRNILARTDDLTQNMSRANAAGMQRGIISIPTQFLHYQIKLMTNLASSFMPGKTQRGFTRGEASRIVGLHLLAYGLAGNGLTAMYDEVMGWRGGAENVSDNEKLAWTQGGMAWIVNAISQATTGEDTRLGLGERLGTGKWIADTYNAVRKGDALKFWDVALGPAYTNVSRMGDLAHMVSIYVTRDQPIQEFASAVGEVGLKSISTLSNAAKAYYAFNNEGKMVSKKGEIIGNLSHSEIVAQALGIPASEIYDYQRLLGNKSEHTKEVKELAKVWHDTDTTRLKLLIESKGVVTPRIEKIQAFMLSIRNSIHEADAEAFHSETEKLHEMTLSETGLPVLTQLHVDLQSVMNVYSDTPITKSYGVGVKEGVQ